MKPLKTISIFLISAFILSVAGAFAFATGSPTLDMLQSANGFIPNYDNIAKNSGTPPPVVPGLSGETASAPPVAAVTTSSATVPEVTPPVPPAPHTPTVLEKMSKDLDSRKVDYVVSGATGALTAYFLTGCVLGPAVLIGFAAVVLFLALTRNV